MIKKIIFDLDNTLIEWKNEYWIVLKQILVELNVENVEELTNSIIKAIDTYEDSHEYYNKESMLNHINKITKYNFDMEFLNYLLAKFEKCVPTKDENVINLLKYLNAKYELVILTNWFKTIQENRLKNFGILHFFKEVYAGEKFKIKPHKESFITAMGNNLSEECIMIGDSLKNDIKGAIDSGIKAIYINSKSEKIENEKYITINNIYELKNIL